MSAEDRRTVSIVIVTRAGRERQAARARAAYARETPGAEILEYHATGTLEAAWRSALSFATGWFVHFGSDQLEPHPGWMEAAQAALRTKRVPTPALWGPDGTPPDPLPDWTWTSESAYPTVSRWLLRDVGPPPFPPGVRCVVRSEYAFTLWPD